MPYADKAQRAAYQVEWMSRRRLAWLAENGPCANCGSTEDLEVDHVDPAQKVSHRVWSWSEARRQGELAKCQALCRTCHHRKTAADQPERPIVHNRPGGYDRGCRCMQCRWIKYASNQHFKLVR